MDNRQKRLEWISLVYLAFFVLAVFSPSFFRRGYLGLTEETLEELTIFTFGLAGIITFALYERLMERREREREQAQNQYQKAKLELMESYAYIGSINRQIELLKQTANDTSNSLVGNKHSSKELFQALLENACSAVGAETALLRVVDHEKLRTEREFVPNGKAFVYKISNKDLRALHEGGATHGFVLSEDAKDILVVPSDRKDGTLKIYLMLRLSGQRIQEVDASLLKVFANQAEMLYRQFSGFETGGEPALAAHQASQ